MGLKKSKGPLLPVAALKSAYLLSMPSEPRLAGALSDSAFFSTLLARGTFSDLDP
jgi:hypothetical protein